MEQEIIWNSKNYFAGHNNWIIILIKSNLQKYYETKDSKIIFELSELIENSNKNVSCWTLMCSRKCNIEYDILDFIEILKFISLLENANKIIWNDILIQEFLLLLLQNILDIEFALEKTYYNGTDELYDKII